jgi:hypothetical protein
MTAEKLVKTKELSQKACKKRRPAGNLRGQSLTSFVSVLLLVYIKVID